MGVMIAPKKLNILAGNGEAIVVVSTLKGVYFSQGKDRSIDRHPKRGTGGVLTKYCAPVGFGEPLNVNI